MAATPDVADVVTAPNVFFLLLLPALVLYYAYYRMQRRRFFELAAKLPGNRGYPIIGNALEFIGQPHAIFERIYAMTHNFQSLIRFWVGSELFVFLFDPRDVEIFLGSTVHLDKSPEYRFFKPWLGDGLLISSGDRWKTHRKLIAPTFHLNVLKSFVGLFNKNSLATVEKLRAQGGKEFDVHDYMSECTVEILLETAMGVDKKTQDKSGFEYAMAVMKMCDILHLRHAKAWLRPDWLFRFSAKAKEQGALLDIIHGLTKKVIKAKKEEISKGQKRFITEASTPLSGTTEEKALTPVQGLRDDLDDQDENDVGQKKRLAFLDMMIDISQNGTVLSDTEIKEEVDTIMFEGHDTTAAGSSFFLCMMGVHQDVQAKVMDELYGIFGDSDRPVTFADTLEMKYLERCLLETLRMYPPVPIIARQVQEEVTLASGHVLPVGATIIIGTYRIHRNPEIYPNPTVFNPDNFLPERTADRHYYAYIPFSAGPRSCVGRKYAMLKLKVILATILRNFRVKSDVAEKDFQLQADIILKRTDGFKIRLEPRQPRAAARAF